MEKDGVVNLISIIEKSIQDKINTVLQIDLIVEHNLYRKDGNLEKLGNHTGYKLG